MEGQHIEALKQARAVLRALSFKDDKVTRALEAIYRALREVGAT